MVLVRGLVVWLIIVLAEFVHGVLISIITLSAVALWTRDIGAEERKLSPEGRAAHFLQHLIERADSPGVQYAFVSPDSILFSFNSGIANLQEKVPVGDNTTFNAYSVTKTLTAVAILRLVEEGKIKLDGPISAYFDFFPYTKSPTIRQTLNHTGGFPNPIPIAWIHLQEDRARFDKVQFLNMVLQQHNKLSSDPGDSFAYSNIGYLLLGEVVEKVTQQPYTEYVERNILSMLEMKNGAVLAFSIPNNGIHAKGYVKRWSLTNLALGWFINRDRFMEAYHGKWAQFRNLYVNGASYGGLIGNARGFAKYLQVLLAASTIVSNDTRALLFTRTRTSRGKEIPVGLGWFAGNLNGEPYFTHAGGGGGYYCEIRLYPKLQRGSVVIFNRTGLRDERFLDKLDIFFIEPIKTKKLEFG